LANRRIKQGLNKTEDFKAYTIKKGNQVSQNCLNLIFTSHIKWCFAKKKHTLFLVRK